MEIIDTSNKEIFDATRKGKIGSSDIVTVAGLNQYKTPLKLWMEMTEKVEPEPENDAMWLGKELEATVANMWARKTEHGGYTKNNVTFIKDWACATPDYLYKGAASGEGILECKTTGAFMKKFWEEGPPDAAHCQVQWQMGIAGYTESQIACLIGGRDFVNYPIKFESPIFDQLWQLGEKFMEFVKTDTPPEARAEDLDDIKKLLTPEDMTISLDRDTEKLVIEYLGIKSELAAATKARDQVETAAKALEARIRMALGDAQRGLCSGIPATVVLKPWSRTGYTAKPSSGFTFKVIEGKENVEG